jgi:hypothetical protein
MAAMAALLTACGPKPDPNAPPPRSEAEKAGYLPSPQVLAVAVGADGAPVVRGRARPAGRIRATLPSGEAYGATADAQGLFELALPGGSSAVMVAISAEDEGRSTPAEGWVFAPPNDFRHAVVLRPGSTSRALVANPALIAVVDFDAGGGAGLSGRAPPNSEVRISVDGVAAAQVRAAPDGHYEARFSPTTGPHRLHVAAGARAQDREIDFSAPAQVPAARYAAQRIGEAWRIDWRPPGGGAQTTFVFAGAGA